ncbi:MAG: hypothetical protein JSW34_09950 [Candidatus Zixiibacteriota bacterium]|nr:MAG: hypothetical protein JSW34_09950 [candidate division Zixibacteria bacterium]
MAPHRFILLLAAATVVTCAPSTDARNPKLEKLTAVKNVATTLSAARPMVGAAVHTQGQMQLVIRNNGTFGAEWDVVRDPLTGDYFPSCIYPKNSNLRYLYVAALWIGAVVGRDTLVSCGTEDMYDTYEFWPEVSPFGDIRYESIDPAKPHFSEEAYSEQDIICEYTDTITDPLLTDPNSGAERAHMPLNIRVEQRSMSWTYDYADDFILFDYQIENIGDRSLENVYMGLWLDGCVFHESNQDIEYWTDDIIGFYRTHPAREGCGYLDTINIAYHADNDGDPIDGRWNEESPTSVVGVRVVRTPLDSLEYSFNWWIMNYSDPTRDFGPRQRGTEDDPFRDFGIRLGSPVGDRNRYYVLRHDEFDYDLLYTAVDHSDSGRGWLPPPEYAEDYATGYDVRYVLSFGPFNMDPGEELPLSLAWVGGENFHHDPHAFESFNPYSPSPFYNQLDFSELATNSRWASWIYDNPGVDTDGDGDSGKFRVCCRDTIVTDTGTVYGSCDTSWYEGDGVPDFCGASPPPAPRIWVEPAVGRLRVRFNGLTSETIKDRFSGISDFEGYRVYIGRDDRIAAYSIVASYDRENYNKYVWDNYRLEYRLLDVPMYPDELQLLYGDPAGLSDFDPTLFTRDNPYVHPDFPDSIFYFVRQDFNRSVFGETTPITKVYPEQAFPSTLDPALAPPEELTDDGYFKYFEYELVIDGLLPTVPYYVNVTAFDFGSPQIGLSALESSLLNGAQVAYPLASADEIERRDLKVFVYPNPYRADADYQADGFENRDGIESRHRMRRIHFANLPNVCAIYIYSLDGDLVRQLDHNYPEGGPEATHETWNLITRNTQAAESGLYYWVVESDEGTQIGKLVIIK